MKVKDLIKELEKFDGDNSVFVNGEIHNYTVFQSIKSVWKAKDENFVRIQMEKRC